MGILERLAGILGPVPVESVKAAVGPGAFAMTYDAPVSMGRWDTPRGMAKAQALSHSNPWIDRAERLICGRLAAMPWHLETPDDETVDDESPEPLRVIRDLLERPSPITKPEVTWRDLTHITSRHMGIINVGAWYLDSLDGNGLPREIFYLNPARLTPYEPGGRLTKWILDADGNNDFGRPTLLELDEVILFQLVPPDRGYFGTGLVESADTKAALSRATDRFMTQTYGSGGRRGSWIGPREGRMPDDVYDSIVANLKNVRESPDSAKRDIVTKGPLDITPQASTPQELQASDVMKLARDDILVLWGIDVLDAGVPGPAGMSSGEQRAQARESTYENAVEPRVDVLQEKIQLRLLDRWKAVGISVELEIERPEFEDDTPAYERAAKAKDVPLRNWERRQILGLDPFGDPVLDNAVWLPAGISEAYLAPDEDGRMPERPMAEPMPVMPPDPLMLPVKAGPLGRTRETVERRITPAIRKAVASLLTEQRAEVLRLVGEKASHLVSKPTDTRAFWNAAKWDKAFREALAPHARAVSETVAGETKQALGHLNPAKADPTFLDDVIAFVLGRGGERVVEMNRTTRDAITDAIRDVVMAGAAEGLGPAEIASRLTDQVGGLSTWNDARAEVIARTETMFAYNDAALASYREYGVERVQAIDGDTDEECAARNGREFTLEESLTITDHPNGTLDWAPVL